MVNRSLFSGERQGREISPCGHVCNRGRLLCVVGLEGWCFKGKQKAAISNLAFVLRGICARACKWLLLSPKATGVMFVLFFSRLIIPYFLQQTNKQTTNHRWNALLYMLQSFNDSTVCLKLTCDQVLVLVNVKLDSAQTLWRVRVNVLDVLNFVESFVHLEEPKEDMEQCFSCRSHPDACISARVKAKV